MHSEPKEKTSEQLSRLIREILAVVAVATVHSGIPGNNLDLSGNETRQQFLQNCAEDIVKTL
ncbi:MAG: hypothetical protein OHK0037_08930 [Elainellaceae cyanobacterium]